MCEIVEILSFFVLSFQLHGITNQNVLRPWQNVPWSKRFLILYGHMGMVHPNFPTPKVSRNRKNMLLYDIMGT